MRKAVVLFTLFSAFTSLSAAALLSGCEVQGLGTPPAAAAPPVTAPTDSGSVSNAASGVGAPTATLAPPEVAAVSMVLDDRLNVIETDPDREWQVWLDGRGRVILADQTGGQRGTYRRSTGERGLPAYTLEVRQVRFADDGSQTLTGPVRRMQLQVRPGPCSTDSGQMPWRVDLTEAGQPLRDGCAWRPWEADIDALLPAIDACLAANGSSRIVDYAALSPGGWATVFLRQPDAAQREPGRWNDYVRDSCVVRTAAGVRPVSTAPSEGPLLPGEMWPSFHRDPAQNPGGECYVAQRAKLASGREIGWFDTPEGC